MAMVKHAKEFLLRLDKKYMLSLSSVTRTDESCCCHFLDIDECRGEWMEEGVLYEESLTIRGGPLRYVLLRCVLLRYGQGPTIRWRYDNENENCR